MYIPRFNQVTDRSLLLEVMGRYSFAMLIGPADQAAPVATHLPLVVKDEGEHGVLEGHFARANPHWRSLAGQKTLVVFPGPHSYVSPTLYTEELSVPTWNYVAVHASGILRLIEEPEGKEELLRELIAANEPRFLEKWQRMPDGYRRTMLAGIVGFRIPIAHIEGKFKLSQNRNADERQNVQAAHSSGSSDQQELAAWMRRLSSGSTHA